MLCLQAIETLHADRLLGEKTTDIKAYNHMYNQNKAFSKTANRHQGDL